MNSEPAQIPAPSQGVIYVATGERYIRSAIRSARSVRQHCPGLAIHLFSDWRNHGFDFDRDPGPFGSVTSVEDPHRRSKIDYLSRTPFDWTLYLDTDTSIRADISGMFRLLERFDIAAAHAHHRRTRVSRSGINAGLPHSFPSFNSGVVLYRRTPAVIRFLEVWRADFHEHASQTRHDQITMRHGLWESDLRLATLPPEYNVRYIKYHVLWSRSEAASKIFHLRLYHVGWFAWVFRRWGKLHMKLMERYHARGLAGLWRPGGKA